ncbi:MAG: S49 family peptidase [Minwuia sp.]|nr:S49 family peptidase [Minwuia sp.]
MTYPGRDWSPENIAARLFDRPLMVTASKLRAVMGVMGPRHDVARLIDGATVLSRQDLAEVARASRVRVAMAGGVRQERYRPFRMMETTAVIPIRGTLVQRNGLDPMSGMTGYDGIAEKFRAAEQDPEVTGIVLDIDSPGGEVAGCFDLADEIAAGTKPSRAILSEQACSAAYALASACDEITMPRTGEAGSIGVICAHQDVSGMLDDMGMTVTLIYAGARKADGNPFEPLPANVHADIQAEIDATYALFAGTVALHRGLSADDVLAQESRSFRGEDAVSAGLVDRIMPSAESLAEFVSTEPEGETPFPTQTAQKGDVPMRKRNRRGLRAETENEEAMDDEEDETAIDEDPDESAMDDEDDEDAEGDDDGEEAAGPAARRRRAGTVVPIRGGNAASATRAQAIADSCTLAGRPDLISGFLASDMSAAAVSKKLLKDRAGQSGQNPVHTQHGGPATDPSVTNWNAAFARARGGFGQPQAAPPAAQAPAAQVQTSPFPPAAHRRL